MNLTEINKRVERLSSLHQLARSQVQVQEASLAKEKKWLASAITAQQVAQEIAQSVQEHAHKAIAGVVSRCLEAVFEEPYTFSILFEQKRGRTEARLVFLKDGVEFDPVSSVGGGVVDVASFALRLASLLLSRPSQRRLLVLDEPFRFVSKKYRSRIRVMLEQLAEEMDVQFIMVTHIDELRCGTVVEVGK